MPKMPTIRCRRHWPAALLAATACAQPTQRIAPGAGVPSPVPERVVAPGVATLEGVPHAVRAGLTVHLSGMVPVDSAGRIIGTSVAEQARQAVANLAAVVRAARGLPGDVVHVTLYLRDTSPGAVDAARAAVLAGLDPAAPPALTVVGVTALPDPAMLVMLDGLAQLRSEFPDRERRP